MHPRFSVIVPAPALDPPPPVLHDLVALAASDLEVFVVTGTNPSRQRNLAAAHASGDIIVFCDSDCRVDRSHFDRIDSHLRADRLVVGGPILLEEPALSCERLFQKLLAHPLLTGVISARYRAQGTLRACGDAELILCNLAVRRDIFLRHGGFEERLYPNEENEWLTRLQSLGVTAWHDPALAIHRPQRKSWPAFFRMLLGYGRGRTKQFLVTRRWDVRQAPPFALLGWLLLALWRPRLALGLAAAAWCAGSLAARFTAAPGARLSSREACAAPLVPLFYALGQGQGFFQSTASAPAGDCTVYRWDRRRKALVPRD